jgi:CP family cyanate transporter-like MFS transporter
VLTTDPAVHRTRWWRLEPVAALLCFALSLRAPITVIPPLLTPVRADLGIDAPTAGLLTSIPVLCFGLLTPVASRIIHRLGINLGGLACVIGVIAGSILRSVGGVSAAFVGTILLGVFIAIGNLAIPMLIGRQYKHRAELLTGAYAITSNVTVTATTALAVPAADRWGWRWTAAGSGVFLGLAALVTWFLVYPPGIQGARTWFRRRAGQADAIPVGTPAAFRTVTSHSRSWRVTALLSAAFAGHTFAYYAVTAWLPTALVDIQQMTRAQAGVAASLFQAAGIAGPLLVPLMSAFRWSSTRIVVVLGIAWMVMPAGMLVATQLWGIWSIFGGMAQAAFFTAVMSVVIRRSRSIDENRRTTSTMQTVGYSAAAAGPVVAGWVHQQVGGWSVPFGIILAVTFFMLVAATLAVRTPMPASRVPS